MMSNPVFWSSFLAVLFFYGLAWYGSRHQEISSQLQNAMAITFVAIPVIGLVWVVVQLIAVLRGG